MVKGSLIGFLQYAAEHPDLVRDLLQLARKYDFEIMPDDELGDPALDSVAGGVSSPATLADGGTEGGMPTMQPLQLQRLYQNYNQAMSTLSTIIKVHHETAKSIRRATGT